MASDRDFYVLRQFSQASVRVALYLQDRIAKLEQDLHEEDELCRRDDFDNGTLRFDPRPKRQQILYYLAENLRQYRRSAQTLEFDPPP